MAPTIDSVLKTMFESEVKQAYQSAGSALTSAVRVKDAKGAQIVKFPKLGVGLAKVRTNVGTPLTTEDVLYSDASVTMVNFYESRISDIFKQNQVAFDERKELVDMIVKAMARKKEQLILDALVAATLPKQVANNISGAANDLTLAALRDAARQLDLDDVPGEGRTLLIHTNGLHHLLSDNTVTSADFNSIQALIKGDLNSFYGFNIIKIGTRAEGGLPIDGSDDRTNFAFHKDAVGLGMNMDVETHIDWDPQYGSWRVTAFAAANACVIEAAGVVEITTREA